LSNFTEHARRIECPFRAFDTYVKQFEEDGAIFVSRPAGAMYTGNFECYFRELNGNFKFYFKSLVLV
jgi:hypothetical protein